MIPYLFNSTTVIRENIAAGGLITYGTKACANRAYKHRLWADPASEPTWHFTDRTMDQPSSNFREYTVLQNTINQSLPIYAILVGPYASNWGSYYQPDCPSGLDASHKWQTFVYTCQDPDEARTFWDNGYTGVYFLERPLIYEELQDIVIHSFVAVSHKFDNGTWLSDSIASFGRTHELVNPEDYQVAIADLTSRVASLEEDVADIDKSVSDLEGDVQVIGANVGKTFATFTAR